MEETLTYRLGTEQEVRERLEGYIFKPLKGGHQIKTVYVSDGDLVVCVPKRRDPIFWDEKRVDKIQHHPVLGSLYRWVHKRNSRIMVHVKQGIKYFMAWVSGDPAAKPLSMLTTLNGHRLAQRLDGMMEPFMILDRVEIQTSPYVRRILSPVIVKERSDKTLLDELREMIQSGKMEEAESRIEEALKLDQTIWKQNLCNTDFSLKNYRTRHGKVVLRDAGHVKDNYQEIIHFLETLHGHHGEVEDKCHPIRKNILRLAQWDPLLSEKYRKRAMETYTVDNLKIHWFRER